MPYTPPSLRSPASSAPTSPNTSRRPSLQGESSGGRPALPRSASYMTKHRRTPSATVGPSHVHNSQPTPEATSEDLKGMIGKSVRQSPPPITNDQSMPKGAVISPPESSSSDDDDLPEVRGRRIETLKALHDAISQIPQHREASPNKGPKTDAGDLLVLPSQAEKAQDAMHHSFSASSLDDLGHSRRISHTRSVTEPNVMASKSAEPSPTASEYDSEDEEVFQKPPMVRKKSGELVRPALRPPSHRRPSSMPGTPTFSKAVHFDSHLEHVRHFLQVDRPAAVSAGSSPADNYDSDKEYPFNAVEQAGSRSPQFEWDIIMNNFPVETVARKAQAVRLERVWLSDDHKFLIGTIDVANLAFQKSVTCRFTLDYWKTTSEVAAEYMSEIRSADSQKAHDRFNFSIKLADLANLESKTLYFAIRYNTNGQEFWDNNGGVNFQVDFRKKTLPQAGKKVVGSRPGNALPRSHRRANATGAPRPKSMFSTADEFSDNPKVNFDQSIHEYLGESGSTSLRLKGVKSTASIASDNLQSRLSTPSGQAFSNRYDFEASLSAARGSKKDKDAASKPDGLYMRIGRRPTPAAFPDVSKLSIQDSKPTSTNENTASANKSLPPVPGAGSPGSGSIASSSYEEMLNKYCFFGSKQSSPQLGDGTMDGRYDGAGDSFTATRVNGNANGNPNVSLLHASSHSQQRPAFTSDPNSYFQHGSHIMGIGASPTTSPLGHQTNLSGSPLAGQPRSTPTVSGQSSGRSASPTSMGAGFQPFAGTSTHDFANYMQDRFPFSGTDAHIPSAIRG